MDTRFFFIMGKAFVSETFSDGIWSSTYTHPQSVQQIVKDISTEEFCIILSLAANALHNMNQSANTMQYKDAIEKEVESYTKGITAQNQQLQEKLEASRKAALTEKEAAVESVESKYTKEILSLKGQIDALRASLTIAEDGKQQIKDQFSEISAKSDEVYRASLSEILRQKDTQYASELARMDAMNKERFSQIEVQHREAMATLKQVYTEQESKLKSQLEKTLVSSEIGKHGELEFEELVENYTRWGPLTNTSKIPHSGDLSGKIKGCSTLFEIKRYTTDVPTKEVDKFLRDMDEHPEVPLGIFISQKSNIIGKKSGNFIQVAWTARSQLLVYVNSFNTHSPQDIFTFLDICAEIALSMFKISNDRPHESELSISLQMRVDQAKSIVECEVKRMAEFINTINLQKKSLVDTITKHHTENSLYMNQSKLSLKTMLDILVGKAEEEEPLVEVTKPVKKVKAKATPSN